MAGKITQMLSDDNGNLSSMRIITSIIQLTVIGTWSYLCIKNGSLISFDLPDLGVLMGSQGFKAYQKSIEQGVK